MKNKYLTITELRARFEYFAMSCFFDIDRNMHGEYKNTGRNTFALWAGYWRCAKDSGLINPNSDVLQMNKYETEDER